jgi:hypothetical protein
VLFVFEDRARKDSYHLSSPFLVDEATMRPGA